MPPICKDARGAPCVDGWLPQVGAGGLLWLPLRALELPLRAAVLRRPDMAVSFKIGGVSHNAMRELHALMASTNPQVRALPLLLLLLHACMHGAACRQAAACCSRVQGTTHCVAPCGTACPSMWSLQGVQRENSRLWMLPSSQSGVPLTSPSPLEALLARSMSTSMSRGSHALATGPCVPFRRTGFVSRSLGAVSSSRQQSSGGGLVGSAAPI